MTRRLESESDCSENQGSWGPKCHSAKMLPGDSSFFFFFNPWRLKYVFHLRWGTTPKAFYSAPYLFSRDETLMFQQVPMVDISEMKSVQTRAVFNYVAPRYDLCGRDLKEGALRGTFSVLSSTSNRSNLVPSLSEQVCTYRFHGQ